MLSSDRMTKLYNLTRELLEFPQDEDIYSFMANKLREICPDSVVVLSSTTVNEYSMRVKAVEGLGKLSKMVYGKLGKHPSEMDLRVDEDSMRRLKSGKLEPVEGGLHQLTFGFLPETLSRALEGIIRIRSIYSIGIVKDDRLLGSSTILWRRKDPIDTELVEAFIGTASMALHKREAENELLSERNYFRNFVESLDDWVWETDTSGVHTYSNRAVENVLGYPPEKIIGMDSLDLWPDKLKTEKRIDEHRSSLGAGEGWKGLETVFEKKDGSDVILQSSAVPLFDSEGNLKGYRGIDRDITEQIQTKRKLTESERKYRSFIQESIDAFYINSPEGKILDYNKSLRDMLGYTDDEMCDLNARETYVDLSERKRICSMLEEKGVVRGFETRLRKKSGEVIDCRINSFVKRGEDGSIVSIRGIIRDVTNRKKRERLLRSALQRNRALLKAIPDMIFILDSEGTYLDVMTKNSEDLIDSREKLLGKKLSEVGFKGDLLNEIMTKIEEVLETGEICSVNYRIEILSGRRSSFEARIVKLNQNEVVVIARNIDEKVKIDRKLDEYREHLEDLVEERTGELESVNRKLKEEIDQRIEIQTALEQSEERYRNLFYNSPESILLLDREGNILEINRLLEGIFDVGKKDLVGKNVGDLFPMEPGAWEEYIDRLEKQTDDNKPEHFEMDYPDHKGKMRKLEVSLSITKSNGKIASIQVIGKDITDRKRMEEEMIRAQKMESIGVMAGGIAHDFNNILTTILGNVSLARLHAKDREKIRERLVDAEDACKRARDLTHQMMTFSRGGVPEKKATSISKLIQESVSFSLRGSNSTPEIQVDENLWNVRVDPGQINQVLNNLLINASQAMPKGGKVFIRADNVEDPDKSLNLPDGRYVRITVRDEGCGIPRENLTKIFDPYFTTKEAGNGLGLATSFSILKNHDGRIMVDSVLGRGTEFNLFIPADPSLEPDAEEAGEPLTGKGKILVMDDDKNILSVVEEMLDHLGYDVETVSDCDEVLNVYKEAMKDIPFDLVILDLLVPGGMGGKVCMEKLKKIDPGLKALISTGYSSDPIVSDFGDYGFLGCIRKPYRIRELSKIILDSLHC